MERITIIQESTGQQHRDYGDHEYLGTITYEFKPMPDEENWRPTDHANEEMVWRLVDVITGSKENAPWPNTTRGSIEREEPGLWRYRCTSPFID